MRFSEAHCSHPLSADKSRNKEVMKLLGAMGDESSDRSLRQTLTAKNQQDRGENDQSDGVRTPWLTSRSKNLAVEEGQRVRKILASKFCWK
jgi:hypothetical protein